jgi:hypothetical protein
VSFSPEDPPEPGELVDAADRFLLRRDENRELPEIHEIEPETNPLGLAAEWVLEDGTASPWGPVETQFRRDMRSINLRGHLTLTLVTAGYAVAAKLDKDAGMATAAVARELREYVKVIREYAGADSDTQSHTSQLSSPV